MKVWKLTFDDMDPMYVAEDKDLAGFARSYYAYKNAELVDACGYDVGAGWHPAKCGHEIPCPDHGNLRCRRCGKPALFSCTFAGSMAVCGEPVCEKHRRKGCGQH